MNAHYSILIVDDEMLIRQGIKNYINWEKEGFHIVGEASHGKEALQMIEELHPHIVITDIVMPVMGGEELVKKVKSDFPEVEIIVLSSFENFEYVRTAFQNGVADYILKPKLDGPELLKILRRLVNKMPDLPALEAQKDQSAAIKKMIQSVLAGYQPVDEEELLPAYFPEEQFNLVSVLWKGKRLTTGMKEKIAAALTVNMEGIYSHIIEMDETEMTLLLNFHPDQLKRVKQEIKDNTAHLVDEFQHVNVVVSEPFASIYQAKEVSEENLKKMKQYTFYLPDLPVLMYDELPPVSETPQRFDLNHFLDVFKHKQFTGAFQYLEDYINFLSSHYTTDVLELKSTLGNILFNIIVLLENMKYDTEELERKKYSYFSSVNDAETINEALASFNDFLAEADKVISISRASKEQSNIQRLLTYIEQHYSEPLNLTELAEHFHFNASYLSTYFSRHHNEGFSEYLNRVRIKKAMQLLGNKSVPISEISEMVGYSDHSYFCKVFKKVSGMSPSSYRREVTSIK